MLTFSLIIDDAVAKASPVLRRMRLDGLDRATLPFEERYVQAWRGMPESSMDAKLLLNVIKVRDCLLIRSTGHAAVAARFE